MKDPVIRHGKTSLFLAIAWFLATHCVSCLHPNTMQAQEDAQERSGMIAMPTAKRKFIHEDPGNHPANLIKLIRDVTGNKVNRIDQVDAFLNQ